MLQQNNNLETLIKLFSKLPSLGQKSATRIVLHLFHSKENTILPLINSLQVAFENVKHCQICGNLDDFEICKICCNANRDDNLICVVEDVADLWAIEKSGVFGGKYHILGGVLSAINGKGPKDLNIDNLVARVRQIRVNQDQDEEKKPIEIILATNSTMEGQTTAYYLVEILKEFASNTSSNYKNNIKISKLTSGIPIGSELDYLDEGTLSIAFKTRGGFG
jgi:recombination protein RecR